MIKTQAICCLLVGLALIRATGAAPLAEKKLEHHHVPAGLNRLQLAGDLAGDRQLRLAIGLPLRNPAELAQLLARLYDPASPAYRHFLTPEEFAARFAPTEADYEKVVRFAEANQLRVTSRHTNRLLLDVAGSARAVNQAFQIRLRTFQHPTEARVFYAPTNEPVVAADLPMLDVSGLSDMTPPRVRFKKRPLIAAARATPRSGSASGGSYIGGDFRAAYVPGTTLDGAGQVIGLVQFDGFYSNDIVAYASQAGQPVVPVQTVLLDGFDGVPTTGSQSGNGEVSLDIEMAMAMAPGLAKVIVYSGGPRGIANDVLNSMAVANAARQLSCSWGWGGGPSATTDQIFQQMAAQGQSFFMASGDRDAYTAGTGSVNGVDNAALANAPSDSPYITVVGGTTLTTSGPGGARVSETTWNWGLTSGEYEGSSGGISSYYALPVWQQGINLTGNGGSTSFRNLPDVALTADNVYVVYGNGVTDTFGGTSCAAPLWAGFMALVNQQAAGYGLAPVGFANPALYALGQAEAAANFHDITTGNNTWPSSPSQFYATNGYDLCTGWGTPAGTVLINALAPQPDSLAISPALAFNLSGPVGGAFTADAFELVLTNTGAAVLDWSAVNLPAWLNVLPSAGNLLPGGRVMLSARLNEVATKLLPGAYPAVVWFTNWNTHAAQSRSFNLLVTEPLLITPTDGFTAAGLAGGPFTPSSQVITLTNAGGQSWPWSVINTSLWLNVSPGSGYFSAGESGLVTVSLSDGASHLVGGVYSATMLFSNQLTGQVQGRTFGLQANSSLVQNGGFETGDLTGWSQSGNTVYTTVTTSSSYVHSGSDGLRAGPTKAAGELTQMLPTVPGKTYFVSFWLTNPKAGTPNSFRVFWDGTSQVEQTNLPALGWTNLHFLATAMSGSTLLQFSFLHSPAYFGLDDVSVTPVSAPFIRLLEKTNATMQFVWNTTAGIVYQVQYRTNLAQSNWLNLGPSFIATNMNWTISDSLTNAERYYQIVVLP